LTAQSSKTLDLTDHEGDNRDGEKTQGNEAEDPRDDEDDGDEGGHRKSDAGGRRPPENPRRD